jgi:hypothetical protein
MKYKMSKTLLSIVKIYNRHSTVLNSLSQKLQYAAALVKLACQQRKIHFYPIHFPHLILV